MRIVYVVPHNRQWWGRRWGWSFAATRYRAVIPARELVRRGHEVWVYEVKDPDPVGRFPAAADAVVIGSSFDRRSEAIAERARAAGARVVADFCDHHFDGSRWEDHHRALAEMADAVTVATPALGRVIEQRVGREDWVVIDDPWECPAGEPRFDPDPARRLTCLWFGHHLNLPTIEVQLPRLHAWASSRRPLSLQVFTPRTRQVWEHLEKLRERLAPAIDLSPEPWTPDGLPRVLERADLVLLPSSHHPHRLTKSPNRPVEALHAGRFPLCWPLPSYQELGEMAWIGEDLATGLEWCLRHPDEVHRRLARARELLPARFAPEVVAGRWEAVLAGRPVRQLPPTWRISRAVPEPAS